MMTNDPPTQRFAPQGSARRATRGPRVALLCALATTLANASAAAPNGAFDPTFGNYLPGRSLVTLGSELSGEPFAMTVLADGRLVLAGYSTESEVGSFSDMTAIRLGANGAADPTFGDAGIARILPPGAIGSYAFAVFEAADGKLLVAGYATYPNEPDNNTDFVACRLASDGALDVTYGGGGCSRVGFDLVPNGSDAGRAAALDAAGRLVITGRVSLDSVVQSNKFGVVRLDPDGVLDASFGANGRSVITRFSERAGMSTNDLPQGIGIAADGRIVVVGSTRNEDGSGGGANFAVARLTANGVIDPGFGDEGVFVYDAADAADTAIAVGFQADGRIVVGGTVDANVESFAVLGLTHDGVLDPDFGASGQKIFCFECNGNPQYVYDMRVQPNDRMVLVGKMFRDELDEVGSLLAVARLLPDGALDSSFGDFGSPNSGLFAQSFFIGDTSPINALSAVALQGDRIVAAGVALDAQLTSGPAFVAIRLTQDQIFDGGFE